jgi:hypothetical protein
MALKATHELHRRRLSRNVGVGLTLVALVALVFGLTVVKVTRGDPMQGFDHQVRPEMEAPTQ